LKREFNKLLINFFCFVILQLLFVGSNKAQEYLANVKFYNYENGLAGRFVNCTFKDSRGLIWIGTQFGLNRFDGRDFLLFKASSGLPFNQVMEILEDDEGWLWLFRNCDHKQGCIRDVAFLHSVTHEIHSFEQHFKNNLDFEAKEITSIIRVGEGSILLSAQNLVIHWSGGKILSHIRFEDSNIAPHLLDLVSSDKIAAWDHIEDSNGNSDVNYFVFDFNGKIHFQQKIHIPGKNMASKGLYLLGRDFQNRKLVGIDNYFDEYKPDFVLTEDGKLVKDSSIQSEISNPNFNFSHYNPVGSKAWSFKDGIKVYNPQKELVFDFSEKYPEFKKNLFLRQIRFDEDDVTWISGRQGVLRIQLKSNPFQRILYNQQSGLESPPKHICSGIAQMEDGKLLLSTQSNFYVKNGDSFSIVKNPQIGIAVNMLKGYKNEMWGGYHTGITHLRKKGSIYEVDRISLSRKSSINKIVSNYYRLDTLWLGSDKGIYTFDHLNKNVFKLNFPKPFEVLNQSIIHAFHANTKDQLWICTSSGLYLYSFQNGVIERFWDGGEGNSYLPGKEFYHMYPSKKGGYWLASKEGLIYWNIDNSTYQHYTTKDGLVINNILAVYEDEYDFLWMPSNQGLIQFQINSGLSKVWLESDGISSSDFELYSHYEHDDGQLWFGTTNGITAFHPEDFKDINLELQADIPFNILDFEQFSSESQQLENRTSRLIKEKQIVLYPGEHFFNLRIALADYVNGKNVTYSYTIEGYQEFWQSGKENLIRISGLPYGDFMLRIRARLAKGQYSSKEIILPIHVLRPFYLQSWFFIGAFIFLSGFIIGWFKWRTILLRKRQKMLETQIRDRTLLIRQKNEQLEIDKKIIEQQTKELKDLDKVKTRFFANISHELRTPLTLILGPLNTVLKSEGLQERHAKLLKTVRKSGQTLLNLTNEILDLTKMESGRMELKEETTVFYLLVYRIVSAFESHAEGQSINLHFQFQARRELQIQVDIDKFQKILNNLLSNAFKFSLKGGKVEVLVKDEGSHISLLVKDMGRGIHSDDLPFVFDRFYQSKQPNSAVEGGTGIGLALCREYAKILKAQLKVESILDKGSTFIFEFPKKEVIQSLPNEAVLEMNSEKLIVKQEGLPEKDDPTKNKFRPEVIDIQNLNDENKSKILLVEDNHSLREYLQIVLETHYNVLFAESGQEALKILEEGPLPSLIISDIMMPIMDGFQLLEKLKSSDNWRHIPVVMLTARAELSDKLKALRIGVDDYLTKPFEEEELMTRVSNLLENHKQRELWVENIARPSEERTTQKTISTIFSEEDVKWLKQLEEVVQNHQSNSTFNVKRLAGLVFLSRSQLQRRVKQLTGLSPIQYIQEARMLKARNLLETRKKSSVKAVTYAVGIRDVRYFSQQFKKRFGKSPSSYL